MSKIEALMRRRMKAAEDRLLELWRPQIEAMFKTGTPGGKLLADLSGHHHRVCGSDHHLERHGKRKRGCDEHGNPRDAKHWWSQ